MRGLALTIACLAGCAAAPTVPDDPTTDPSAGPAAAAPPASSPRGAPAPVDAPPVDAVSATARCEELEYVDLSAALLAEWDALGCDALLYGSWDYVWTDDDAIGVLGALSGDSAELYDLFGAEYDASLDDLDGGLVGLGFGTSGSGAGIGGLGATGGGLDHGQATGLGIGTLGTGGGVDDPYLEYELEALAEPERGGGVAADSGPELGVLSGGSIRPPDRELAAVAHGPVRIHADTSVTPDRGVDVGRAHELVEAAIDRAEWCWMSEDPLHGEFVVEIEVDDVGEFLLLDVVGLDVGEIESCVIEAFDEAIGRALAGGARLTARATYEAR